MAVVDTALEKFDFIDPDRLGVIGGSYGGYMTSWIIGHTNRFKAAISERAVNNLVSMFGSSDLFWVFERQFGGPLWDNVDAYLEKSPSTYAKDIETPVLVLHSEQDLRCNIEQGEHLFTLLRLLGKDVELLRFPAESHELSRAGSPIHRVHALRGGARVVRPLPRARLGPAHRRPAAGTRARRTPRLPAVPVHHRVERLALARLEVGADRVRDRDERDLRHLVVGDPEDLRGLAARASDGTSSRRCRARASAQRA